MFAWSGGAVLLTTRYLADVGLFDEQLFLYYEDVDLSWRERERGWRTGTCPESVVRHVHSASTVEGSPRFDYYNERNRLLTHPPRRPAHGRQGARPLPARHRFVHEARRRESPVAWTGAALRRSVALRALGGYAAVMVSRR